MEEKQYELVGIFNYFDIIPGLVYPIFKDSEGKYYGAFINNYDSPYIEEFIPFPPKDRIKEINFFTKTHNIFEGIKEYYQVGDLAIGAFQMSNKDVYYGRKDKLLAFLKKYKSDLELKLDNINSKEIMQNYLNMLDRDIEDIERRLECLDNDFSKTKKH